jgi:hypothetical protein
LFERESRQVKKPTIFGNYKGALSTEDLVFISSDLEGRAIRSAAVSRRVYSPKIYALTG